MEKSWNVIIRGDTLHFERVLPFRRAGDSMSCDDLEYYESSVYVGGKPIPMPSFEEAVERAKETQEHFKRLERERGMPLAEIFAKEAKERAEEERRRESEHEEVQNVIAKTKQSILEAQTQEMLEKIQGQREHFQKCLAEINDFDVKKVRDQWQKPFYGEGK